MPDRVRSILSFVLIVFAVFFSAVLVTMPRGIGDAIDLSGLLTQVQGIAASFGPWGVLAAAAIGVFLRFYRPATPAAPVVPLVPGPAPSSPGVPNAPSPTPRSRPVLDWLINILGGVAAAKYPDMHPEEALNRHLAESVASAHYFMDTQAEGAKTAAAAATPKGTA